MSWSWSHSSEGIQNVMDNIEKLSDEDIRIVYAEWKACDSAQDGEYDNDAFDSSAYDDALKASGNIDIDGLVQYIQDRCSEAAICDNGGFNAWVCPSGCHTVSFEKE